MEGRGWDLNPGARLHRPIGYQATSPRPLFGRLCIPGDVALVSLYWLPWDKKVSPEIMESCPYVLVPEKRFDLKDVFGFVVELNCFVASFFSLLLV